MVFVKRDARSAAAGFQQAGGDFLPGGVAMVEDAAAGVAALAAEVDFGDAVLLVTIKLHPSGDQLLNAFRSLADNGAHHILMAEAGPGIKGIGHVQVHGIIRPHDGGDAPLGPGSVGGFGAPFGEDGDGPVGGGTEGKAQPGNAAADHKEIVGFHQ